MKLWKVTLYDSVEEFIIVDGENIEEAFKNAEKSSKGKAFTAVNLIPNENTPDEDMLELCKISKLILNNQKNVNKIDFLTSIIEENLDYVNEVLNNMDITDRANAKLNEISKELSRRITSTKLHNKSSFINEPILNNKINLL